MFERVAAGLANVQCPKTIVNDCDVFSEYHFQLSFKGDKHFQFIRLYWNVIIFEKLVVSLNILVDWQLLIAFLLWVLITYVINRAQAYYKTKPSIA